MCVVRNRTMYYIRATGDNRFTGDGTSKWLKIRNFAKYPGYGYEIAVQIQGRSKYIKWFEVQRMY